MEAPPAETPPVEATPQAPAEATEPVKEVESVPAPVEVAPTEATPEPVAAAPAEPVVPEAPVEAPGELMPLNSGTCGDYTHRYTSWRVSVRWIMPCTTGLVALLSTFCFGSVESRLEGNSVISLYRRDYSVQTLSWPCNALETSSISEYRRLMCTRGHSRRILSLTGGPHLKSQRNTLQMDHIVHYHIHKQVLNKS